MSALQVIDIPEERASLTLDLPDGTTFGEWLAIGRKLRLGSHALNWHIGDWWKFGLSHWGEEETRRSALEIWGVEGETARVYGWVASKFDPVNRLTDLSFTHYQRAASLPIEDAKRVIARAAAESLTVREVQREVQAIKAANDPERPAPQAESEPEADPVSPATQAQALGFAEDVVELCEMIARSKPLTRRQSDMLTKAQVFIEKVRGKRKTYKVPDDFEVIFVEQGRLACETIFAASRVTVNHWLIQRGKRRLIEERAAYVRFQRDSGRTIAHDADVDTAEPIDEAIYAIARQAAQFLRVSRYGGWIVTDSGDGTWRVGTVHKTSAELIAMAERQGFDAEAYRLELSEG